MKFEFSNERNLPAAGFSISDAAPGANSIMTQPMSSNHKYRRGASQLNPNGPGVDSNAAMPMAKQNLDKSNGPPSFVPNFLPQNTTDLRNNLMTNSNNPNVVVKNSYKKS
jgi:hypothetical protein